MYYSQKDIESIKNLLLAYADGNYGEKGEISGNKNDLDSIIASINMLGEELLDTTVSRDYFSSVYDSVTDMLFVTDLHGVISDVNFTVSSALGINRAELIGTHINAVFEFDSSFFDHIVGKLESSVKVDIETELMSSGEKKIPLACSSSKITGRNGAIEGYLISAKDISERIETEKLILRTIVNTQEQEQKRLADDLHDSLGQELTSVKLYLDAITNQNSSLNEKQSKVLNNCMDILSGSIGTMRSICFNLMPKSLEEEGIIPAISELISKYRHQELLKFEFKTGGIVSGISKPVEVTLYRVFQEFINNTVKHANAKNVFVQITQNNGSLAMEVQDDGIGFNHASVGKTGRGLGNISSRIKAYNGTFELKSKLNQGTKLHVRFPAN